ncbi:MAG: SIS domain-containing protein [Pseudomonadota bacterium]
MSVMLEEARQCPAVASRLLAKDTDLYDRLAADLAREPPPFVAMLGRGSSGQATSYGAFIIETLLGVMCGSLAPSTVTLHDARLKAGGALALAVSQSGRSPDLVQTFQRVKEGGSRTVALVNKPASPLADLADTVLPHHAGDENAVAATKTFVASLVGMARLVTAWSGRQDLADALTALPDRLEEALSQDWSRALDLLRPVDHMLVIARGASLSVAGEAALKLKETCALQAEAFSAAEVMHGPRVLVEKGYPILGLAPSGPDADSTVSTLAELARDGANVLCAGAPVEGGIALPLPAPLHPMLDPIVTIAAFYPFVAALSVARGLSPDQPRHLSKVTETI